MYHIVIVHKALGSLISNFHWPQKAINTHLFCNQSRIIRMSLLISREWIFFLKKTHFQESIWILRQMCSLKPWMAGIFLAVLFYLHVEITRSYNKVISFYSLDEVLLKRPVDDIADWHRIFQQKHHHLQHRQLSDCIFFKNKSLTYNF